VGVELDADEREPGRYLLTVRGTKTNSAARVILLSDKAVEFIGLGWLMDGARGGSEHVFGTYTYTRLADEWDHVRSAMGFPPDATLKALRRTFARYATEKGMPAPVLMQYLGHTQIETTMGYLRLVGAYDPKVVAQWL
jgi:integrase